MERGTALLTVLVLVVILGLAAGMAGQSMRAMLQREREAELLWRGQQFRRAIASYYRVKQMYPSRLEELLRDPRFPGVVRHLRRPYGDPMTGGEWELVKDPAERLIGVRSTSDLEPFKQAGFPGGLEEFEGKTSYREWEFVFVPAQKTTPARTGTGVVTPQGGAGGPAQNRTPHSPSP